jgi:hypothetical protein
MGSSDTTPPGGLMTYWLPPLPKKILPREEITGNGPLEERPSKIGGVIAAPSITILLTN